ncbi:hypothetical protein Tco_1155270 [Tanacetum coccineum]
MRILSVIGVNVFKKYGYNYLREIILRRADYQEYKISKKDFKNLHLNDFEDLFLLNIQGKADYYFKEDYTIVPKPRVVVYRDRNDQRKLMRLNELHKFSDGTLTRVMEKLDHMVKDFHLFEYNKGMGLGMVAVSSSLRLLEPKRTIESRAKRSSINLVRTQHPSETMVVYNEDGNPARANIKQALGRPHKGVKASANSDVMYFFTSAQDSDPSQDDVRLCLGDDLKKAQDHSQRQAGDLP